MFDDFRLPESVLTLETEVNPSAVSGASSLEHIVTHEPVLLDEVLSFFKAQPLQVKSTILDGTLGLGGYSKAILETFPNSRVLGLDRDFNAIKKATEKLASFNMGSTTPRFSTIHANFSTIAYIRAKESAVTPPFQGIVLDLGVSNMQLMEPKRGFSFQQDGPLDMRMNPDGGGITAADALAQLSEQELARIFRDYGDERYARSIAAGIVADRERRRRQDRSNRLETTGELVALIRNILPEPVQRKMGGHPARRVFQALRIFVNNELSELESALNAMPEVAAPGCVVVIVSYHSLEDRIVKHQFRAWEKGKDLTLGMPLHGDNSHSLGKVLTRHPVLPQESEIKRNHRARSAKLRAFQFN